MMRKNVLFGLMIVLALSIAVIAVSTLFNYPEMFIYMSPAHNTNITGIYNVSVGILSNGTHGGDVIQVSFLWYLTDNNSLVLNFTDKNYTTNQTLFNMSLFTGTGFNTAVLPGGYYNISVVGTNFSGDILINNSIVTGLVVDNSPPNVTVLSPTDAPTYTIASGTTTFQVQIKDYPARVANNVTFELQNGSAPFGGAKINISASDRNTSLTTWNITYNVSKMRAGLSVIRIFAYDNFGIVNKTITLNFTVNSPFNTSIIGSPEGQLFGWGTGRPHNDGTSNFSINLSIISSLIGSVTNISSIFLMFDNSSISGETWFNVSVPIPHEDRANILTNLSFNLSRLRPGIRTMRLWVNDTLGNINQSQVITFEVNRQFNVTWLVGTGTNNSINVTSSGVVNTISTGVKTFNVSIAGNSSSPVMFANTTYENITLMFNNASGVDFNVTINSRNTLRSASAGNFLAWFESYNISTLKPGTNTVTIWVNDSLDNRNITEKITFEVNSLINVTHRRTADGRMFNLYSDNTTFNVTAHLNMTNISHVIFMFDNASGTDFNVTVFADRGTVNETGQITANGSFTDFGISYNVSRLAEGNHTVRIFVNDSMVGWLHGDNRNASETITFWTDYTIPSTTITRSSSSTASKLVLDVSTSADAITCEEVSGKGSLEGSTSAWTLTYTGLSAATSYEFNIRCADELANNATASGTFSTDAAASTGSGASGSGGGSSAGITGQFGKEVWASINAGETATVEVDNGVVGVTEVSFVVPSTVYGAWVKVAKVDGLPSSMASFSGAVYKNVEITKGVALKEDNIKDAVIDFKVEKTWLTAKGLTQNQVAIYRFADNKWNELPTVFVKDDGTSIYYTAKTPGFSYFIIGEKGVGAAAEVPAGEVPAGGVAGEVPAGEVVGEVVGEVPAGEVPAGEAAQKASWPWIVAIVLVIIIAAGVIIYLKRRR